MRDKKQRMCTSIVSPISNTLPFLFLNVNWGLPATAAAGMAALSAGECGAGLEPRLLPPKPPNSSAMLSSVAISDTLCRQIGAREKG